MDSRFGRTDAQITPSFALGANRRKSQCLLQVLVRELTIFAALVSWIPIRQISGDRPDGDNWRGLVIGLRHAMAIARILFPLPLPEPFDYTVPDGVHVEAGSYVRAPLGKTMRTGVVWEMVEDSAAEGRELKPIEGVYPAPAMTRAMRSFMPAAAH